MRWTVHFARIIERREMRETSVEDVWRERDRFGQLDVDGNFNVKLDLIVKGEKDVEFSNTSLGG